MTPATKLGADSKTKMSAKDAMCGGIRPITMRDTGLEEAIKAAGGVASLARAIGIAQPSVSNWTRVPAERVLAVEALTNVPRFVLRPDIYGEASPSRSQLSEVDEIDQQRGAE